MSTPKDSSYKLTQQRLRLLNKESTYISQDKDKTIADTKARGTNITAYTKHIRQKI